MGEKFSTPWIPAATKHVKTRSIIQFQSKPRRERTWLNAESLLKQAKKQTFQNSHFILESCLISSRGALIFAPQRRSWQARTLALQSCVTSDIIFSTFLAEQRKRKDSSFLSLGYAEFLFKNKQTEKAKTVLNRAIRQSTDKEFLEAARDFYRNSDEYSGEQSALQRLAPLDRSVEGVAPSRPTRRTNGR